MSIFLPKHIQKNDNINIKEFSDQVFRVDLQLFLFSYIYSGRKIEVNTISKKDLNTLSFIRPFSFKLLAQFIHLLKNDGKNKVLFVLDGKRDTLKKNLQNTRQQTLNKTLGRLFEKCFQGEKFLSEYLRVHPSFRLRDFENKKLLNYFLQYMDCFLYKDEFEERDIMLGVFQKNKIASYVVSNDLDSFLFGAERILKKTENTFQIITLEHILKKLNLQKRADLIDLVFLSGNDYTPKIPGLGIKTRQKLLEKKTFQEILKEKNISQNLYTQFLQLILKKRQVLTQNYIQLENIENQLIECLKNKNYTEKQINYILNLKYAQF
jgi:5'-3' exonuclease